MTLLRLAVILVIMAFAGPLVWNYRPFPESDFIISMTAFSIGVLTFFGTMELSRPSQDGGPFKEGNMRTAIASSLVTTYLFVVCFTAFVKSAPEAGAVTKEFIQSFSQVVSFTIAFYFGASAIGQIYARPRGNDQDTKREEKIEGRPS